MGTFTKRTVATLPSLTLLSALPVSAAGRNSADPYESHDRFAFDVNDKTDYYVFTPVTRGYRKAVPKPVRAGVSNFFNNLRDIVSFGSNVLRLDAKRASEDLVCVDVNTTFGLGRLIDVAGTGGILNDKNIPGNTPTSWGWKNSNYFVIPLLGPPTACDTIGSIITIICPAKNAVFHASAGCWNTTGFNVVDNHEGLPNLTGSLEDMALDKYSYTRDLCMWIHARQIGGTLPQVPDDDTDVDELVDSDKPDNLSPAETTNAPQTTSAPVAREWVCIRPEGGSNAG